MAELCKANPIPVPPSLVEQQAQMTERELLSRRAVRRAAPLPRPSSRASRADAEMKVRAGLLMAEIAKAQRQVKVTDEDIEKGYDELAEQTGKNVAKVKAEYRDPKKREMLIGMILEDKILDLIEAKAEDRPRPEQEQPMRKRPEKTAPRPSSVLERPAGLHPLSAPSSRRPTAASASWNIFSRLLKDRIVFLGTEIDDMSPTRSSPSSSSSRARIRTRRFRSTSTAPAAS